MNYSAHYERLIARARDRVLDGYVERHHVIPKCMGGSDKRENLVQLTAEEHFVAHQLLHKIYPDVRGLSFALVSMTGNPYGHRGNKLYGWIREKNSAFASESQKEMWGRPDHRERQLSALTNGITPESRKKAGDSNRGRRRSLETRLKMSTAAKAKPQEAHDKSAAARRGAKRSPEICLKMAKSAEAMSPEARARIAAARWPKSHTA